MNNANIKFTGIIEIANKMLFDVVSKKATKYRINGVSNVKDRYATEKRSIRFALRSTLFRHFCDVFGYNYSKVLKSTLENNNYEYYLEDIVELKHLNGLDNIKELISNLSIIQSEADNEIYGEYIKSGLQYRMLEAGKFRKDFIHSLI